MAASAMLLPRQHPSLESCSGRSVEYVDSRSLCRYARRPLHTRGSVSSGKGAPSHTLSALPATSSTSSQPLQPVQALSVVSEPQLAPTSTATSPLTSPTAPYPSPLPTRSPPDPSQPRRTGKQIEEAALQAAVQWQKEHPNGLQLQHTWPPGALDLAYERCGVITKDYAKTFYLGTNLMTPEKANAIWAIYVWCRRTDELVDGPNASQMTPAALDQWEERLEALFDGRPYDILDAALTATISKFPVCIQPFRDMIDGMRMDLQKSRYRDFDELYEYCYKVAGTVGLMTAPVMGVEPSHQGPLEEVYRAALSLGVANQLTNILRDVGEDANERNRLYVPLEELARFDITEEEAMQGMFSQYTGSIDDRWVRFMKFQISRARAYFADAQSGVDTLDQDARWPVWSALILYRQILDAIEKNGFDNFTQRAYVRKWKKYVSLPLAYARARFPSGAPVMTPAEG